jgi:hypothetical protein
MIYGICLSGLPFTVRAWAKDRYDGFPFGALCWVINSLWAIPFLWAEYSGDMHILIYAAFIQFQIVAGMGSVIYLVYICFCWLRIHEGVQAESGDRDWTDWVGAVLSVCIAILSLCLVSSADVAI